MRRLLIVASLVAIVAAPLAVANVGFCRSMPCCAAHAGAQVAAAHHSDCCNTTNCGRTPAAAREYTSAKHLDAPQLVAITIAPAVQAIAPPREVRNPRRDSAAPPPLQRRIALLSILLI